MVSKTMLPEELLEWANTSPDSLHARWLLGRYLSMQRARARTITDDRFFAEQLLWFSKLLAGRCTKAQLRIARRFYDAFPRRTELDPRLRWQHYRLLIPLPNAAARQFYLQHSTRHN